MERRRLLFILIGIAVLILVIIVAITLLRLSNDTDDAVVNEGNQTSQQGETGNVTENLQIYLVSIGTGSIGCGDSLEVIELEADPELNTLEQAISELVSINTEEYPGTDLHSALWQSDLTVGETSIEGDVARVALSGDMVIDDACDAPRIQAQLERTAIAAADTSQAEITLNDQPLAEALSQ